ncbi:MAG: aminotransferase class III-fold pyridoxal phosphate-dependent enzyme, partial [Janthinobacterium lividum]
GNPVMTAIGLEVVSRLSAPEFLEGVRERSAYLSQALLKLSADYDFKGERGEGLLRALLLGRDIGPQIVEKARLLEPAGLLINAARPNLLRFMPALNVTHDEIDQMIALLRQAIDQVG